MTKKTRYFLMVSATVLAVGLTTGVVASFIGLPLTVFSSQAGPAELEYVPEQAAIVAYADVRDVMNSEFRQRIRQLEPEGHERDEFLSKTGVDIERDIDTIVAAVLPRVADGGTRKESVLVLARGRFDVVRLEGLAREHGGQVEEYQGARFIRHMEDGDPSDMALGFIEPGLVAIGSWTAVRQAIDTKRGGGPNVIANTELMRLVADLGTNNAWAVGRFDALTERANLPSEMMSQMPAVTWFSAAGHVNGGLSGLLKAEARDEVSAQHIRDMLRGFVALAKLQADSRPELQAMVNSLQLGGTGKTVALSFTLPTEFFEVLGAMAGAQREAAQQPR